MNNENDLTFINDNTRVITERKRNDDDDDIKTEINGRFFFVKWEWKLRKFINRYWLCLLLLYNNNDDDDDELLNRFLSIFTLLLSFISSLPIPNVYISMFKVFQFSWCFTIRLCSAICTMRLRIFVMKMRIRWWERMIKANIN